MRAFFFGGHFGEECLGFPNGNELFLAMFYARIRFVRMRDTKSEPAAQPPRA